jgi:nucleotide-binding universal stress UspA family protein
MPEIIVGVNDSAQAQDAVAFARRLAGEGVTLALANAYPYDSWIGRTANPEYRDYLALEAAATLSRARDALDGDGVTTHAIADPSPARALQELAERDGATLIVVGSTHRGRVGRVLAGTTADRLFHGAPCPVAIVPQGYATRPAVPIRSIGVGYDGSEVSRAAVNAAADIAGRAAGQLQVIRVFDATEIGRPAILSGPAYVSLHADFEQAAREELDRVVASLSASVEPRGVFLTGTPGHALIAQSDALDLLLLGGRGYGPLRAVLVGGVSHMVVRDAGCPVVVLPRGAPGALAALFASKAGASV